ncbi:MAG: hypothetical protein IJQ11_03295 [Bacteroidales bacterium]|nr:hypothetical protein [Bacteroidales bacterium]
MNKLKISIMLPMIGLGLLTACGLWHPKPPVDNDPWLTPDEAYEDETARTGMDGGAFVTRGLKIRNPDSLAALEGYTPNTYVLSNGIFDTLPDGHVVYRRIADDLLRCRVWALGPQDKLYYFDAQGFLAPDTIAFDGYSTAADGSWDETKPRVP